MANLDNIIGVDDAAKILNKSPGTIKNMCAEGKLDCKKIGKTWVLDETNLEVKKMYKEKFTVLVGSYDIFGDDIEKKEEIYEDEAKAESLAKEWAKDNDQVYIRYDRASDGQVSYLNPRGYEVKPVNWVG